jgi:hypothetical protein
MALAACAAHAVAAMTDTLSSEDLAELRAAKRALEHPSLAIRISDLIGSPIEEGIKRLPVRVRQSIDGASHKALGAALELAVATLDYAPVRGGAPANGFHKAAVTAIGASGGAFGVLALPLELPAATLLMLRSIADVARAHGEDLTALEARLACLEVFALGGPSRGDDQAEAGYYAVRAALATAISDATRHIAAKGLSGKTAPAVIKLISAIARRFGIAVTEKVMAQMVPLVGAAGGAAVNLLFIEHYQAMAAGHFTVRKLERKYSPAAVRSAYELG